MSSWLDGNYFGGLNEYDSVIYEEAHLSCRSETGRRGEPFDDLLRGHNSQAGNMIVKAQLPLGH